MVNLELKHFCDDFKLARKILSGIGAEKVSVSNQEDWFFHLPSPKKNGLVKRLKFRKEGEINNLILYSRGDFSSKKNASSTVSVFPVGDMRLISFLSDALGVKVVVNKKREVWKKDNAVFHLDDVRSVGRIFEMELEVNSKRADFDRRKFDEYRAALRPCLGGVIKKSNEDLVLAAHIQKLSSRNK